MKRVWHTSSKVLAGLFLAAMYAMPQAYTISARPGAVNYIEGHAFLNDSEISQKKIRGQYKRYKIYASIWFGLLHMPNQVYGPFTIGKDSRIVLKNYAVLLTKQLNYNYV